MHLPARLPPNSSLRSIAMGRAIYFNANVSDAMAILPTTPCTAIALKTEDFDPCRGPPVTPVGASRLEPPVVTSSPNRPVRALRARDPKVSSPEDRESSPRFRPIHSLDAGHAPFATATDGSESRGFLPMATKDYADYVHRSCLACQKRIPRWTDGKPTPKSKLFCSAACRSFHRRLQPSEGRTRECQKEAHSIGTSRAVFRGRGSI